MRMYTDRYINENGEEDFVLPALFDSITQMEIKEYVRRQAKLWGYTKIITPIDVGMAIFRAQKLSPELIFHIDIVLSKMCDSCKYPLRRVVVMATEGENVVKTEIAYTVCKRSTYLKMRFGRLFGKRNPAIVISYDLRGGTYYRL